jgi:hypothetical protein
MAQQVLNLQTSARIGCVVRTVTSTREIYFVQLHYSEWCTITLYSICNGNVPRNMTTISASKCMRNHDLAVRISD